MKAKLKQIISRKVLFLSGLFVVSVLFTSNLIAASKIKETPKVEGFAAVQNTPEPSLSALPYETPVPSPTIDPDPIIDCKLPHSGIHPGIRKSLCDTYTDCQLGDKWVFYTSIPACKADQKKQSEEAATKAWNGRFAQNKRLCEGEKWMSAECLNDTNQLTIWLGGTPSTPNRDYEIENRINDLENEQQKLEWKLKDQEYCARAGGYWSGYYCRY